MNMFESFELKDEFILFGIERYNDNRFGFRL